MLILLDAFLVMLVLLDAFSTAFSCWRTRGIQRLNPSGDAVPNASYTLTMVLRFLVKMHHQFERCKNEEAEHNQHTAMSFKTFNRVCM